MKSIILWDAPLRIFHWTLAALVVAAFVTGLVGGGLMEWHGRIGAGIAALLGFRLAWGVVGTTHARFASFIKGPPTVMQYLRGNWRGIGHNPLGALSVVGMLGVLILQVLTGLPAYDDIAFRGPYNVLVSQDIELLVVGLHKKIIWLVGLLVALHLSAIVFYSRVKGDNLVRPMITGRKEVDPADVDRMENSRGGGPIAIVLALIFALLAGWAALGGPVKYFAPPPPPPVETPNW